MSALNPWTLDHCESPDTWSHSPWRWHNSRTRGTKDLRSRTALSVSESETVFGCGLLRHRTGAGASVVNGAAILTVPSPTFDGFRKRSWQQELRRTHWANPRKRPG